MAAQFGRRSAGAMSVWLLFVSGLCVSVSCACVGLLISADKRPTDTDKRERPETMVQRADRAKVK